MSKNQGSWFDIAMLQLIHQDLIHIMQSQTAGFKSVLAALAQGKIDQAFLDDAAAKLDALAQVHQANIDKLQQGLDAAKGLPDEQKK